MATKKAAKKARQEGTREEGGKEGREEEVVAEHQPKGNTEGDAQSVPLSVFA